MGADGNEELAFDSISVLATDAIPGDYNQDGRVDAADYVHWRKGVGVEPTPINYEVWLTNFGQPNGSGSGINAKAAIPEPATLVLPVVGMLACALFCGRQCHKLIGS
jgi:hypothetical protein